MRSLSLAAALVLALLAASSPPAAAKVILRVERAGADARLYWTGGAPPYDAYQSLDARRVVSPARVLGTTAATEIVRPTPAPDAPLVFLEIGCAGAGCDERCYGGADDDGDTLADCADPECAGTPDCVPETRCTDGLDDEGDDLVDCDDPDCRSCDDGDACTADACDPGSPTGCRHDPVACDDLDACTTDACEPAAGCVFTPVACSDGDACNGLETCDPADGSCAPGAPVACDDGAACNGLETCDPADGSCRPGTPPACDDGDPCNGLETCDPADGSCRPGTPPACDDGNPCNGAEACDPADGSCRPGTPPPCDDGDACNGIERCDPSDGSCAPGVIVSCDDGNPCNGPEACDPATGGCLPGTPPACDDGDACNGLETCDTADGSCLPGIPVRCSDGDACTTDACDPASGACSFPVIDCDDRDACTADSCDPASGCVNAPVACSDGDACTDDACDPALGCLFTPRSCDDGLACTLDSCDPAAGCRHDVDPAATIAQPAEIAGRSLAQYPWFAHVAAFNADAPSEAAVDTSVVTGLAGRTCDVYVVAERTDAQWCASPALVDVRGAPDTRTFAAGGIRGNRFALSSAGQLGADAGTTIGRGYDVVLDCDRDGVLDSGDFLDGLGPEAGMYAVADFSGLGPLATSSFDQTGPLPPAPGPWLTGDGEGDDVRVHYPAVLDDPTFVGTFPLVMISHGNGHSFAWYVFLQQYLASWGFIVASHDNDTFFGIEEASSSTLYWTDKIIRDQPTEGGGVLDGHVDSSRIGWIGHSRGGEGVVRAYDRMHDEGFTPQFFSLQDVRLVASLAPTDFLGGTQSDPHDVPYLLVYGAADGDVSGCPEGPTDVTTSFNLYERGTGEKSSTYIHGAGHEELHDCGVSPDEGAGPARPGCASVHQAEKPALLAEILRHVPAPATMAAPACPAAKDYLWRQYEDLRASGSPAGMTVDRDMHPGAASGALVVDDHESQPATSTSSSGGNVTFSVQDVTQGLLDDADSSFDWSAADPFNGMTRVNVSSDSQSGVTFWWTSPSAYEMAIVPAQRDVRGMTWLALRAAQIARAPETTAALSDLTFTVKLFDGAGRSSGIAIDAYAGGLEEPYQRDLCSFAGAGWQDEMEVVRIRLDDFRNEASALDLSDIRAIRLEVGGSAGSAQGRIAIDDVRFER